MTQTKATKRALFMSMLSLLLCISMLIGSTFAWFTDSVTSGKNKITAGNLDIELYHTNEFAKNEPVTKETPLFVNAEGKAIEWEPGVMTYENFTVKNAGTLALKYKLAMYVYNNNTVTVGEEEKSLADVIKVAILNEPFDATDGRDAALAEDFNYGVKDFVKTNDLMLPDTEEDFAVILYWEPSDKDNDYNINNDKTTSDGDPLWITLGVDLRATQTPKEVDSFNEKYDDLAELPKVAFDTETLVSGLHEGGNVVLEEDGATFLLDTVTEGPGDKESILGDEKITEDVSIDLNGHTMLAGVNQAHASFTSTDTMFGCSNFSMKNGTYHMERAKVSMNRDVGRAITLAVGEEGTGPCNVSFENVVFKNDARASQSVYTDRVLPAVDFAVRGYEETTITFKDCTFYDASVIFEKWNARYVGDIGPTIVFDNCTFNVSAGNNMVSQGSNGSVIYFKSMGSTAFVQSTNLTIRDCKINYTSTYSDGGAYAVDIVPNVNVILEGHNVLNGSAAEPHAADTAAGEWKGYDDIAIQTIKDYAENPDRYKHYDNIPYAIFSSRINSKNWSGQDTLEYQGRAFVKYPKSS